MSKTLSLEAQVRQHTGSKTAAVVRKSGRIPAIMYGHKQEPVALSLDEHDFVEGVHHGHRLMEIQVAGKTERVIVKDLQYDHLGRKVIHADLMRVDVTEMVEVTVPLELKGVAKGTHEGGILEQHVDHLEIACLVTDIPERIPVLVKELGVGQVIHACDVPLPEGVKLVSPAETLLTTCHLVAAAKTTAEVEAEEAAAPEVIGAEKETDEGGEGDSG
jgi:large subunit ribosomal protein L25